MDFKNVLIFGDSYSTFAGYIPNGFAVYYSDNGSGETDVSKVSETWWYQLLKESNSELIQNNSWSGSTVCYTGYDGDCSETSSFIGRLNKLACAGFFEKNEINTHPTIAPLNILTTIIRKMYQTQPRNNLLILISLGTCFTIPL